MKEKVTLNIELPRALWEQVKLIYKPYGNANQLFADLLRLFAGERPHNPRMLERFLRILKKMQESEKRATAVSNTAGGLAFTVHYSPPESTDGGMYNDP